jgi:hypothetical protein
MSTGKAWTSSGHNLSGIPCSTQSRPSSGSFSAARATARLANDRLSPLIPLRPLGIGPVSRRRQRRTRRAFIGLQAVALLPTILRRSPRAKAVGLGLSLPGGGFLFSRRWGSAVASLVAFTLSALAWVGAGMTTGPIAVWLGSAALAGRGTTRRSTVRSAEIAVPMAAATIAAGLSLRKVLAARKGTDEARRRNGYLATLPVEPSQAPPWVADELTVDELKVARVLIDMGVQPVDEFDGFVWIEQFQPPAVRYQICYLSYALAHLQYCRTPAFQGYMQEAQRNLIKKLLIKRVWRYWALENAWGNLSLDHDPVPRDNIMLTGFMALALGLYGITTGQTEFDEPGSLTFPWNDETEYRYDFEGIARAVRDNFVDSEFGMFPCEPNWIYSVCNTLGALGLATYDKTHGTKLADDMMDGFRRGMNEEFSAPDGRAQVIRSKFLGWSVPMTSITVEAMMSMFIRPVYPGIAARWWEIVRREFVRVDPDGTLHTPPNRFDTVDTGNYQQSELPALAYLLMAAREMGDEEIFHAARSAIDERYAPVERHVADDDEHDGHGPPLAGPALVYDASPQVFAMGIAMGLFGRTDGFYDMVVKGRPQEWIDGPQIASVPYPHVMVARAVTDGRRLDAVFQPGTRGGTYEIALAQLKPRHHYTVTGATTESVTAGPDGTAELTVNLQGRLEFNVVPAHTTAGRSS